jgi:hypothetical protein
MNKRNNLLCAHGGILASVLMTLGLFIVAGWMPLVPPSADAETVASIISDDRIRIRIGMTLLALSSVFLWSFAAAISMQMKRIEGNSHPLSYVQMASSTGTVLIIALAAYFWLVAAFRPDLPSSTIQMLSDFAWLTFVGFYPAGFIQNIAIGLCILSDERETKVYPRWVGYANLWIATLFLPGALLPFFKSGPFSWNGIIGFWLVAFVFFGWVLLMWWMTVIAIKNESAEEEANATKA